MKSSKIIKFINGEFYQKTTKGEELLGNVFSRKGNLTHEQKLKIISNQGKWTEIK